LVESTFYKRIPGAFRRFIYSTIIALVIVIPNLATVDGKGEIFVVQHQGKEYRLQHLILGTGNGVVEEITVEDHAIKTAIQSEEHAHLVLIVPIELLDAAYIPYESVGPISGISTGARVPGVFVDGGAIENYTASMSQSVIIFKIPFEAGAEEIEISGIKTPEFDGRVFAVMGMSIAGIVIATARYRNKLNLWKE
jgi:hypothetical protein